jgi:hypothetical protein
MDQQSVYDLLRTRADRAGVQLSPHGLRRSFVSDLLDRGVDITTVAAMAGRSSVKTTARYDRCGAEAKRHAARALHVPNGAAKQRAERRRGAPRRGALECREEVKEQGDEEGTGDSGVVSVFSCTRHVRRSFFSLLTPEHLSKYGQQ